MLNNTVDGKEIYNTIRHKTKDGFYKNIVKKGYLLKKSEFVSVKYFPKNNMQISMHVLCSTGTSEGKIEGSIRL